MKHWEEFIKKNPEFKNTAYQYKLDGYVTWLDDQYQGCLKANRSFQRAATKDIVRIHVLEGDIKELKEALEETTIMLDARIVAPSLEKAASERISRNRKYFSK